MDFGILYDSGIWTFIALLSISLLQLSLSDISRFLNSLLIVSMFFKIVGDVSFIEFYKEKLRLIWWRLLYRGGNNCLFLSTGDWRGEKVILIWELDNCVCIDFFFFCFDFFLLIECKGGISGNLISNHPCNKMYHPSHFPVCVFCPLPPLHHWFLVEAFLLVLRLSSTNTTVDIYELILHINIGTRQGIRLSFQSFEFITCNILLI